MINETWRTIEPSKLDKQSRLHFSKQGLADILDAIWRGYCEAINAGRGLDVVWYVDGGHLIERLAGRGNES
jgi:hypothetical protein